jgi:hypothetical protein
MNPAPPVTMIFSMFVGLAVSEYGPGGASAGPYRDQYTISPILPR